MRTLFFLCLLYFAVFSNGENLPTLYEHYTSGGIHSGLQANSDQFTLNGKHFVILGGSFHFFRVVPQHWRSVLLKMKAAGINTVDFYMPWNLHEEKEGHFDFNSERLNLAKFLEEIKNADMFAMARPGPYICSEWEMGGLPSWLLKDEHMKLRYNYKPFVDHMDQYMSHAMKIINQYQFSVNGGPVIMLQLENEYFSSFMPTSIDYIRHLHDFVLKSGFKGLLFTSDSVAQNFPIKDVFPQHDVLETANLWHESIMVLSELKQKQVNKPAFVSEFWTGIQDFWGQKHGADSMSTLEKELNDILFKVNASANFYMFIGGTNFGFMNGARIVTSYDFKAPLSEWANYTEKYHMIRSVYMKAVEAGRFPKTRLPDVPKYIAPKAYGKIQFNKVLPLEEMLKVTQKFSGHKKALNMEKLGQNFGFILYRVEGKAAKTYEVMGSIHDRSIFLVDHTQVYINENQVDQFKYNISQVNSNLSTHYYDLLVENQGRENFGIFMQSERKGLQDSEIKLDETASTMDIYSLEFNQSYVTKLHDLHSWIKRDHFNGHSPAMFSGTLQVTAEPEDTFITLPGWTKGNVFVNGFNVGRFWAVGPQKALYIPGPLLKKGDNVIDIFELHQAGQEVEFINHAMLG